MLMNSFAPQQSNCFLKGMQIGQDFKPSRQQVRILRYMRLNSLFSSFVKSCTFQMNVQTPEQNLSRHIALVLNFKINVPTFLS